MVTLEVCAVSKPLLKIVDRRKIAKPHSAMHFLTMVLLEIVDHGGAPAQSNKDLN
jgi:hypothetical protein